MEDNLTKVVVCLAKPRQKQRKPINQDTFFIDAPCVNGNFHWVTLDALWSNILCLSHYEQGPVDNRCVAVSFLQGKVNTLTPVFRL